MKTLEKKYFADLKENSDVTFDNLKLNLDDAIFNKLQLCYRGEGNDNLVLFLPGIKLIFRLNKNKPQQRIEVAWEKYRLKAVFSYLNIFISQYFTSAYFTSAILAEISAAAVKQLNNTLRDKRSTRRAAEKEIVFGGMEIYPDYTFLQDVAKTENVPYSEYRNYVHNLLSDEYSSILPSATEPTFCVEIKPKQAHNAESYHRLGLCAFCMHQFLKLREQKIKTRSRYCPLDLFSGVEERMKNALRGLLETPQNNLKIFKDGKLVYADELSTDLNQVLTDWFSRTWDSETDLKWCIDHFCQLIVQTLLTDFVSTRGPPHHETPTLLVKPYEKQNQRTITSAGTIELVEKAFSSAERKCHRSDHSRVPKKSILGRILELQRIDQVGLETVIDFYESRFNGYLNDYSYVDQLISGITFTEEDGRIELPQLDILQAYLLSRAARDLSILIAIRKVEQNQSPPRDYVRVGDQMYQVNISAVDVGPKPMSSVRKHWKQDIQMLSSCLKYFYPEAELTVQ